jgi:flavorubredoxin
MEILVAYYPLGEVSKIAKKFEELAKARKINIDLYQIRTDQTDIKQQFKTEKQLVLNDPLKSTKKYDLILIGTPIISFSSVPAVNVFIRTLANAKNKNICLFATGIGLPGKAIKKMSSLLSMKSAKVIDTQVFSSIFEFDSKKLKEVDVFFERFIKKI